MEQSNQPLDGTIYHERQRRQLCALHVLNNLFQSKDAFTKAEMDEICISLSPENLLNPHRSMLGLGNYDVNVLMAALQRKQLATVWFDKRKSVNLINLNKVKGFILNEQSDFGIGFIKLPIKRKHWFVLREINGVYYNLDSKLTSPDRLGNEVEVVSYLTDFMKLKDRELLLVVEPDIEQSGSWMKSNIPPQS